MQSAEKDVHQQVAQVLVMNPNTSTEEIVNQIHAIKSLAARSDAQKEIIDALRQSMQLPATQVSDRSKDEKLKLQAPLMSEKINYTTAKFFDQSPNDEAENIGNSHQRA